jgi:hypothetical protein
MKLHHLTVAFACLMQLAIGIPDAEARRFRRVRPMSHYTNWRIAAFIQPLSRYADNSYNIKSFVNMMFIFTFLFYRKEYSGQQERGRFVGK